MKLEACLARSALLLLVWLPPLVLPALAQAPPESLAEILGFERDMEAAVVRGDVSYLDKICAGDFSFTHGDGWTTGGAPLRVENRAQWLAAVAKVPYASRQLESVRVEPHGDIAITYGSYRAKYAASNPEQREFTVWFERVYARRDGRWQFVSHRTVHGPVFADRRPESQ